MCKQSPTFTEPVTSVRESTERFPNGRYGLCERGSVNVQGTQRRRKVRKEKNDPFVPVQGIDQLPYP